MFIAIRDLVYAKGRFLLMGVIVALVAFLTAVLTGLSSGLIKNNISGLMELDITHIAFEYNDHPNYRNSMVERSMWEVWQGQPGVRAVEPLGHTMFNARSIDDVPLNDVVLWGIEAGSFLEPPVTEGEQLGRLKNGVIISGLLAEKFDLGLGDIIILDRVLTELEIVGITPEKNIGHVPIVYTPMRKWQEATYGPPGGPPPGEKLPDILFDFASVIMLQLDPEADIEQLDIDSGTITQAKVPAYAASSGYKEEVQTVQMIEGFLVLISSLVIGAFFVVWTIQRTQEIGLIKALGGSTWFVLKDALVQALILMITGTLTGTALGIWAGFRMKESLNMPMLLEPETLMGASLLLIIAGLAGAMVSVRIIGKIDPIIALGRQP
ncbi:MAG: ABC transporter permease [Gammaproteobacteria bacterium]